MLIGLAEIANLRAAGGATSRTVPLSQPKSLASDPRAGMFYMIATCAVFAVQDGVSRHVAESVSVYMVVMLRFWFFAALAIMWAARSAGGLAAATRTAFPKLQALRAVLLISEICLIMFSFVGIGLIATHAVFICYPLIIAALSVPFLGEKVGWRRWSAIIVGFVGVLFIINPGASVLTPWTLVPLACATLFAGYSLLTRYVAREDSANVSFFWTGVFGAILITPLGLWHWQAIAPANAGWIGALCLLAITGNWLLIKAYEVADASSVQPFTYFQFPFVSAVGLLVFGEALSINLVVGATIVMAAGLFTLWRERVKRIAATAPAVPADRP
ncbi:MAG: DMT family transporter [Aliihoeflea sp.]|uniref:DMT family transporter n=1 Tax=Aliihoeflea sp. TaxID=2608088 RepID=UPI0040339203